ncbi:MAG: LptF/LptG family permease [Henriciella sp.]|nr:LptF/LptG family permease [Hyphomonadaceae bacterium]
MNHVQRYLFNRVLRSVLIIVGGLTLLAILAQGLSQTEIIVENRQGALTFFKIVALGVPQIVALLMPMAMFVASIWALNRLHRDSEIVVAQAAGMTRWQVSSPIIRLAVIGAVAHLGVNLWVQPTAQREMRATISEARADLASSLVRPGQFTTPDANLTVFARDQQGQDLIGVQIAERIGQPDARDYLAERGRFIEVDGQPAIVMFNGQIHQLDQNGALNILNFEQSTFDLTPFMKEDGKLNLKASDRYLHELLFIDRSSYNERRNEAEFLAEANSRLSSPLISIAMAMLAILAVMGGNFSRRGYGRRIVIASSGALVLIIIQLSVQSASGSDPAVNIGQWMVPILAIGGLSYVLFYGGNRIKGAPRT